MLVDFLVGGRGVSSNGPSRPARDVALMSPPEVPTGPGSLHWGALIR